MASNKIDWNEIKRRATLFSKNWEDGANEDADAKSFWERFFEIFGLDRRKINISFEHKVVLPNKVQGYIDVFWPSTLLVEHKSKGKDLNKAFEQAKLYLNGISARELPRYILVTDFDVIRLVDLIDDNSVKEFRLKDLSANIHLFGFVLGVEKRIYDEQDPVNIMAAELMGELHDKFIKIGYTGRDLEIYLVRLLFCLFADDTGLFLKDSFHYLINDKTEENGSDLAPRLAQLFDILNTPPENRLKNLDEDLASFPYVNGKLFEERLPMANFDKEMRAILLKCCTLHWGYISPAIFGSMFQSVMDKTTRRKLGAHYTSEKNILKVIEPLFLDELKAEFEKVKTNPKKLTDFHAKLGELRFLDPACGCGNFLVVTYKQLRLLEIEVIRALKKGQQVTNIEQLVLLNVDKFYGIEYDEFAAQVAQVALWLTDHQMNSLVSAEFGDYMVRLPLTKSAVIYHENALRIDWGDLIKKDHLAVDNIDNMVSEPPVAYIRSKRGERVKDEYFNYIIGNPPFIGKQYQNKEQKADMERIWAAVKGAGVLDYVTCWYLKAAHYLKKFNDNEKNIKCAFVSTNSIVQGEQPGILWNELFNKYHVKIHFAHQTFKWSNEAKGNAGVHCVIIGFSNIDSSNKFLFEYESIISIGVRKSVSNINPYLVEGKDFYLLKRTSPICKVNPMDYGSMANDGGFLLLNDSDKEEILKEFPQALPFIKKFVMGDELINNISRWCLWFDNFNPSEIKNITPVLERIQSVREIRLKSTRKATNELASFPYRFGEVRQPKSSYIALPRVSSENRKYIPIAILSKDIISGDKVYTIENSSLYYFGMLTSQIHMAWMRLTAGRLESRYSYSNLITYNNYPWPENPSEKQIKAVEAAAQAVLDARKLFPESSLADLYNPLTMPPALVKAHQALDKAVDQCYRPQPFASDTKRVEFLFDLYDKYTAGLFATEKKAKKTAKGKTA